MDRFPKLFYVKIFICGLLIVFIIHLIGSRWEQVKTNPNLSMQDKLLYLFKDSDQPTINQQDAIYTSADDFNQLIDRYQLNVAINQQLNQQISNLVIQLPADYLVWPLEQGALNRIDYIISTTESIDQLSIDRSTLIDDYQLTGQVYHMGEQIYELFIHTGDIHLKTWENPQIFAEYLIDAMQLNKSVESGFQDVQLYITGKAFPNIRQDEDYLRIIVVANLIYD